MSRSLCRCCMSAGFFPDLCLVAVAASYLGNPLIPEVQVLSCCLSTGELVSTHPAPVQVGDRFSGRYL